MLLLDVEKYVCEIFLQILNIKQHGTWSTIIESLRVLKEETNTIELKLALAVGHLISSPPIFWKCLRFCCIINI